MDPYIYYKFIYAFPIRIERDEASLMYKEMIKLDLSEDPGAFLLNRDGKPYLMVGCTEFGRWKNYGNS